MKSIPHLIAAALLLAGCSADDTSPRGDDAGGDAGSGAIDAAGAGDANDAVGDAASMPPDAASTQPDAAPDAAVGADAADAGPDADAASMGLQGDVCAEAIDVTAGGAFFGNTNDATDDYDAELGGENCPSGAASGPDMVYALSPTEDREFHIEVAPAGQFDPFLYVKADCAADACIAGTVLNGPGEDENLDVLVPGGSTYYIIVDGELGDAGGFTLAVAPQ